MPVLQFLFPPSPRFRRPLHEFDSLAPQLSTLILSPQQASQLVPVSPSSILTVSPNLLYNSSISPYETPSLSFFPRDPNLRSHCSNPAISSPFRSHFTPMILTSKSDTFPYDRNPRSSCPSIILPHPTPCSVKVRTNILYSCGPNL